MKVEPTKPVAAYVGGKSKLSKKLSPLIDSLSYDTYVEPFIGMGSVFFQRQKASKSEVINDRSGDISNFFRIIQRHYPQFLEMLCFQVSNRREFERLKKCDPDTLTDLERALRFLYLQKLAFGGKVYGRVFGISSHNGANFNSDKLAVILEKTHKRLAGVVIENLDWQDLIPRYDREGTLFYCDPPYYGTEHYYGKDLFDRSQYALMSGVLSSIKGRFILSINDTPEIREIFSRFNIEEVSVLYTLSRGNPSENKELIITNFNRV